MEIKFHKLFEKHFKKLPSNLKKKVLLTINKFASNPFDQSLRNHKLTGKLKQFNAISATSNIRIIFEEHENYTLVLMLDVGGHDVVYK